MDNDFSEILNEENIDLLFVDDELTSRAMMSLLMENELKMEEYKEWLGGYSKDSYDEYMGHEYFGYAVDSSENRLISKFNKSGNLSFGVLESIRELSHFVNEKEVGFGENKVKRRLAIPLEISLNWECDGVEVDKFRIDSELVNELLISHGVVNGEVLVYKYAFSASAYPVHRRSDYMRYFFDRIAMNEEDARYTISPIRSRSYLYDGEYPKHMREYFIVVDVIGEDVEWKKTATKSADVIFKNSISELIQNGDRRITGVACGEVNPISTAFKDVCALSMKGFVMDTLWTKIGGMEEEIYVIDVYVRTSSMLNEEAYNQNTECMIDIVVPGYWDESRKGKPVITYKCENSVEVIEILQGVNALLNTLDGVETKFSTVQYEKVDGALIYTSNEGFRDAYMGFKQGLDFYYYEEELGSVDEDIDVSNEGEPKDNLIRFPGVEDEL